jgi:hypothetical protein
MTTYPIAVREIPIDSLAFIGVAVFATLLIVVAFRGSSKISQRLLEAARSFGWENPRRLWWNGNVRGRWRGLVVELSHMNRYKGIPERLQLRIRGEAPPSRMIIKRRTGGFLDKPMTMFGPPLVEPMTFAERDQYWIRADQMMQAEAVLGKKDVVAALDTNLIGAFDAVNIDKSGVRILRALDEGAVKARYHRATIQWRRDPEFVEQIAREEWPLAAAMSGAVAMRPAS